MSQVLTTAEVDALLAAVSDNREDCKCSTKAPKMSRKAPKESRPADSNDFNPEDFGLGDEYDEALAGDGESCEICNPYHRSPIEYEIVNQDRIIRGRMPTLDIINDKLSRSLAVALSKAWKTEVNICVNSTGPLKFSEFMNTLPLPTCVNISEMIGLDGFVAMVVEPKIIRCLKKAGFSYEQSLLEPRYSDGKWLDDEAMSINHEIDKMVRAEYKKAWKETHPLSFKRMETEINPQYVAIIAPSHVVIATTYDIETEAFSGTLKIVLPYESLEPIKEKLSRGFTQPRKFMGRNETFLASLADVPVTATIQLHEEMIPYGVLRKLSVGDTLPFKKFSNENFKLAVNGDVIFEVKATNGSVKTAYQVVKPAKGSITYHDPTSVEVSDFRRSKINPIYYEAQEGKEMSKLEASIVSGIKDSIPVNLSVELGRTTLMLKDLKDYQVGSVVELDKIAGEPMEVFISGKLVALGEVVVVNEKFGIRITQFVDSEK